jgi:peptidoglycan/LPS O-acetylase OafA/YrhL
MASRQARGGNYSSAGGSSPELDAWSTLLPRMNADQGGAAGPAVLARVRDARLDGLRAISALAVLLFHAGVLGGGSMGVDVFFVLSGFLITNLLAREIDLAGGINLKKFLARRVRRLLPALMLVVAVYAVGSHYLWPRFAGSRWLDVLCAAFYLTDFREAYATSYAPLSHTWSLALEAQFYLMWPFATAMLMKMARPRAAAVLLLLWAVLTVARDLLKLDGLHGVAYFAPPFHATGLFLGAALALRPLRLDLGWAGLAGLAVIFLWPWPFIWPIPSGPAFWLITAAELAAALVIGSPPRVLGWRPLALVGLISYGVYLWHIPLLHLFTVPGPDPRKVVGLIVLSIGMAALSYLVVERPIQRTRHRPVRPTPVPLESAVPLEDRPPLPADGA